MQATALQDFSSRLAQRGDIALAILLVAIIFMMVLPIPTLVLDILLGLNIGISILLLMMAIYIPSPLSFSAFPSVLLLTTLFRLSLSIASTRLILLHADAGKIIQTFGEFVVGGNLVVGLVVFLIITIVQFIVITKGSERISEVSARFSLDAMPGKQMSIDSDMRAGVITLAEARHRRERLEKESQLYGSMDGAMKFVKGDAIAGLIIIIVNIVGGLSIGTMQNGMDMGSAVQLYSILTIGDGLVTQIPALFISITAGIIVTRVTIDDDSNLGSDIGKQILAQPSALLAAAAIVAAMGAVPGFPTTVFLFLGSLLAFTGITLRKAQTRQEFAAAEVTTLIANESHAPATAQLAQMENKRLQEDMQPLSPALVELPEQVKTLFSLEALNQEFTSTRRNLYLNLGVPLPGISLRLTSQLAPDTYRISVRGIPVAQGQLKPASLPGNTTTGQSDNGNLVSTGQTAPDNIQTITRHLLFVLHRHSAEFIGIQELHALYSKLEQAGYLELVREAQRVVSTSKSVDIMRRLLSEGVSIRDLRQILETLAEYGETEKDLGMLAERVRISLKRQLSYTFTNGTGILPVYMLAPETEKLLQTSLRQSPGGVFFAFTPETTQNLSRQLRELEAAQQDKQLPARPVILTGLDLRRHLRRHIAAEFADIPVMSPQELTANVSLQPAGEIRLT
ncbi:MAG TPA: flagellar biosynthesis protein FlhA [Candidatus Thiothrix moscowensis]|uniref:FHIPEP family type III secretion protein n=1 Tax=unclassified Thiothrix TaxID=2636184 RepID=UPI0025F14E74|nr:MULTISPECIES: flagellar biosynthesis protein FlhA [unclassified Thiothrix]HRJ54049.1 flagellar biosynthesis protein FlhA [Candidatus Thiothrix moscowensis]HRJ94195.1 flagellar biosynthesis protein FlhA [Candidatus Thiothrix moscowensis]